MSRCDSHLPRAEVVRRVTTVIWDFDGTLADTLGRNLAITRRIVERIAADLAGRLPALADRESYGRAVHAAENWRELYVREFGIPIERTPEAAALWTEFHEDDNDMPELFSGVSEVVRHLSDRRQGIVSQNGHDNIRRALAPAGLLERFEVIVADEDLPFDRQKPAPDGLLRCAEELHAQPSHPAAETVLYVGDHPVDIECTQRAAARLADLGHPWRVLSVGVEYGANEPRGWRSEPDFRAQRPEDILRVIEDLEG